MFIFGIGLASVGAVVVVVAFVVVVGVVAGNVRSGVVVRYSCVRLCLSRAVRVAISCGNSDLRRNSWDLPLPMDLLAFERKKKEKDRKIEIKN